MAASATDSISSSAFMFISLCFLLYFVGQTVSAFDSIYQFGDSLSDTGNYVRQSALGASSAFMQLPYGETYFKRPTGRPSNGRLMVDHLAEELGLPFLDPFLKKDSSDFRHGVNFAIGGGTALDTEFLDQYYNFTLPFANNSLHVQLDWFLTHLNSMCTDRTECEAKLKRSLFVVGEFGLNDYANGLDAGKSIAEIKRLVPRVVKTISSAVKTLIYHGATTLIVPGLFPIGCFPTYLTVFVTNDSSHYDNNKCLKSLNDLTEHHNEYLRATLTKLSNENPDVVILYADYYNAFLWTMRNFGYENEALKACCGTGGEYNFGLTKTCGDEGLSPCLDASKHLSWDGIHFTDKATQLMTKWFLNNLSILKNDVIDSSLIRMT